LNLLIRSARLIDSRHPLHGKRVDIHVRQGVIQKVAASIQPRSCGTDVKVVTAEGLHVSIGWFDMAARFCDPGEEYKEDIYSGAAAATAGGFTGVLLMPDIYPPVQSKADVEYILNKSRNLPVEIYVAGALTRDLKGETLAEIYDMKQAGAIAFTNSKNPVSDAGQMLRSLLYVHNCQSLVLSHPCDPSLAGKRLMNESVNSVLFGMKGAPALAEEIMLQRDLMLCQYAGCRIHFMSVSCHQSVAWLKEVRKKNTGVTAGIAAHQLFFTDDYLATYDTRFKVDPPFRTEKDRQALIKALQQDVIDVIYSDHTPQDQESKNVEFELARHGIIALETAFACAFTVLQNKLSLDKLIEKIAINPRKILHLPIPQIRPGEKANLTLFDPYREWIPDESEFRSKSKNSPFIGIKLKGKALGTVLGSKLSLMDG
jgi:dihydroorotase